MSMNAKMWKSILVAPAIVWAAVLSPAQATVADPLEATTLTQAQPATSTMASTLTESIVEPVAPIAPVAPVTIADKSLADIPATAPTDAAEMESIVAVSDAEQAASAGMEQVTSVSQLTDVQPTDWAFQALQSLVERYGCIVGYPDSTFKGNRAITRYEFAAGVNACLDRVNELIASGTTGLASKEDLATLQKLQEEFAAEIATLRGRVDALEARTTELEANQFSTTTKLNALVWFNLTGATFGDELEAETVDLAGQFGRVELRQAGRDALTGNPIRQTIDEDPEITFSNLGWLSFTTSFTGKDTLVTQLVFGNGESPTNRLVSAGGFNTWGTPFLDQTAGIQGLGNDVVLRELFYQFPVTDSIQLAVGPRVNWYRYFDNNRFNFFITGTSTFNSNGSTLLNTIDRGSGAVAQIKLGKMFQVNLGYLGENDEFLPAGAGTLFNSSSDPERGLFGGTWTATAELAFTPTENIGVRFLYNRSRIEARGGQIGGVTGEPLQNGLVDAGPGFSVFDPVTGAVSDGGLDASYADTFNINFDWLITKGFGIFARYSYGNVSLEPIDEEVNVQSFQAGVAFPDLGKQGALATFSFLIPFDIVDGEEFFVSGAGDGGTQIDLELAYFYPLTSNIALVPAFYAIINPNNFEDNPTVFVGNLRAQFAF
jgi:hypothetical protein